MQNSYVRASRQNEGLKPWKEESKGTPWIKQHKNKNSKWAASEGKKKLKVTISPTRKSSTEAENKYMVKTSRVTLIAQNTFDILKESGLFVYLCKIYTQIHMYICTHRHYCTYVYAIINTTALWQVSAFDSGYKREHCSCAKPRLYLITEWQRQKEPKIIPK